MDFEQDLNIEEVNVKKDVSIVFMGTPDFAVPVLEGLIENYKVKAVVTQPDKPVGRNGIIKKSPIKRSINLLATILLSFTLITIILSLLNFP